jgi:hypothetical protein
MTKQANNQIQKQSKELTEEELNAKIALTGNLADLSPEQQMSYYARYCAHLGLDPITRPFDLLTTFDEAGTQKTVLYANASCSAQLADRREISYSKPEKEYDSMLGVLTIRVEAFIKLRDGAFRGCWRSGVAHIDGLKGKRLENAIKKAETQAHRRATLALCGVAMPDESEIEDIPGAYTAPLSINSATGGIYDRIGELLRARKLDDSSGARRYILDGLASGAYQGIAQMTGIPLEKIEQLARHIEAERPRKTGNTTIAEEIIAANPERYPQIEKEIIRAEQAAKAVQDLAEEQAKSDPVPLLVTLTPAQQKASDAVMAAIREHKKDKVVILHLISQYLGYTVTASKDLTDEAAEKVFAYLQTIGSQWSDEAKTEPIKHNQNNPAYGPEIAIELDAIIKKLTILRVPSPVLSKTIHDVVMAFSGRDIANRYEMNNDEALAVIDYLRDQLGQKECERAIAEDEV